MVSGLKVAVKVGRKIGLQMLQTELSSSSSVWDTSSRYVAWKTYVNSILSITFHFEQVQ